MPRWLLIFALVVAGIPALLYVFWVTHILLGRLCVWHARRFCGRSGWVFRRARWRPEFDVDGCKTEFTRVQVDCLDAGKQRRLLELSVWPLGIRKLVSDGPYPDALDTPWPSNPMSGQPKRQSLPTRRGSA